LHEVGPDLVEQGLGYLGEEVSDAEGKGKAVGLGLYSTHALL